MAELDDELVVDNTEPTETPEPTPSEEPTVTPEPTETPEPTPSEEPEESLGDIDLDELRSVTGIRKDILEKLLETNPKHVLWHLFEGVKHEKITVKIRKQIEAL